MSDSLHDRNTAGTPTEESSDGATGRHELESHKQAQQHVQELIARKEMRRLRAKTKQQQQIWFGLGMFGLIGWSVTVPTLIGAAVGMAIDARWETRQSWTLMLMLGGLFIGCLNAWRWLRDESEVRDD